MACQVMTRKSATACRLNLNVPKPRQPRVTVADQVSPSLGAVRAGRVDVQGSNVQGSDGFHVRSCGGGLPVCSDVACNSLCSMVANSREEVETVEVETVEVETVEVETVEADAHVLADRNGEKGERHQYQCGS